MGASGSVAGNGGQNIEMNIADEASRDGRVSIKRHSSQPTVTLFSSLRPRQWQHVDGNTRPSVSLPPTSSFDPSSSPVVAAPADAVEKIRKDYDTLKFTKEQEIQALLRKEQKLDTENNRLRAELQALNKRCQKLRTQRDTAMERSCLATERATALEEDREKIQRQFKIFRETKESEIQALLQAKRQLESKFQCLQAQGMATIDDQNYSRNDLRHENMHLSGQVATQSDWWAAPESETTSLFGSYTQLQNGGSYSDSIPDMQDASKQLEGSQENRQNFSSFNLPTKENWLTSSVSFLPIPDMAEICSTSILRCYVSSTPDVINEARSLITHPDLQNIKEQCEKEGYFLSIIHFTDLEDYGMETDNRHPSFAQEDTMKYAISICSIFIAFVGSTIGRYTEMEFEEGHFNEPGSKSALFCIVQNMDSSKTSTTDLIQRANASSCKQCINYESPAQGCAVALKEISKAVKLEFGVRVSLPTTPVQTVDASDVAWLDEIIMDPQMEQTQQELALMCNKPDKLQAVGQDKCYDRLDEVMSSPGPVPPLLVSGTAGSGKTLILSSWTMRLRNSHPNVVVLQHFVTGQHSIDAEPIIVLRRLLSQLLLHLPSGTQPPTQSYSSFDVTRLRETLPRWLEQLSSRCNKRILLVIDSIDLIKEAQLHFKWLLDPLYAGVRVIISVGVNSCPEEWRQFPTLHLEPLSVQSVKTLLKEQARKRKITLSQQWVRDVIGQCRTATTCHPLYVTLLSVLICSVCEGAISENVFYSCSKKQDSLELYRLFLYDIEMQCSNREIRNQLKGVLQFIVCSRIGLSETEIMSLLPEMSWLTWTSLYRKLVSLCIVKEQAGLITPHNSEAASFLYNNYIGNEVRERRYRQKMLTWLRRSHSQQATPRNVDLLLWMLHIDDEREELMRVIKCPRVFHIMYSRGRNIELVHYWNYLNEEKHAIAGYYATSLKHMEASSIGDAEVMREIAQMYESLGRFLKDMGLMEEAVSALQRSLEIQETVLDPDHPAVADSLHHLASVYGQWGKLTTAESLYKQALELVESAGGRDHLRVAQELNALVRIARKTNRHDVAEMLQQRAMVITSKNGPLATNQLRKLRKRALRLEELTLQEDSLEAAQALNDLGVLYHLQNNLENAESFFVRSLKIRQNLLGSNHIDVAQSQHNLASLYNQRKMFKKALQYMESALTIRKAHFAVTDKIVVNTLKYLAILYKKVNDFDQACATYKQLVEISVETTGEHSNTTADALVNLAVAECQNKSLDSALPLYKKALEIYRKTLGQNSQQVSQTLRNIAVLLFQQGDMKKAANVYKESMGGKEDLNTMIQPW